MADNVFDLETAGGYRSPSVRQLSVFVDDRVGVLMRLIQTFEGSSIRVVGMSVVQAIDCAIIRLLCDDTDQALALLKRNGFPISEAELVVVEVPPGHGLLSICSALLAGEINIDYMYPLLSRPGGRAALAIHTDSLETAVQLLRNRRFTVLAEEDLGPSGGIR